MDENVEAKYLPDYNLVAYALKDELEYPYGYIKKNPTLDDPNPFPEVVVVEGGMIEEGSGEFRVLVSRPSWIDPEMLFAVDYALDIEPQDIGVRVGAEAYANRTGSACYPPDFERRLAYRHHYESGENVLEEWKQHYEGYIYRGEEFPGLLMLKGGAEDVEAD